MVPLDLLVMVGGGAVLPYLAEAAWDWLTTGGRPSRGANAPD